jgi:predicted peptidase
MMKKTFRLHVCIRGALLTGIILAGLDICAGAGEKAEHMYDEVPKEQWQKLVEIRNSYGAIPNLDALFKDHQHTNGLPYHVYVPPTLTPGMAYPLVIFLHGWGDLTLDTHKGFPKGVWTLPGVQKKHPHIVFIPRHRKNPDNWSDEEYIRITIEALDDLVLEFNRDSKTPNIDPNRIYLTGFSKGGVGTWVFVRRHPKRFAAAIPLAGFGAGPQNVEQAKPIAHVPIWIICGGADKAAIGSRASFQALKEANAPDVRYHEYVDMGHVIDDFAYFTPDFMEWMFRQRRK